MISRFFNWLTGFFLKILIVIETFLISRIFLKILNANPETPIVKYLYKLTGIIVSPFQNIFPNFSVENQSIHIKGTLDVVAATSAAGYLLGFLFLGVIGKIINRD